MKTDGPEKTLRAAIRELKAEKNGLERKLRLLTREFEHDDGLLEEMNDALCSLLHTGDEAGEHSPRSHLKLFYREQKRREKAQKERTETDG